ncbi:hypothetical protein [Paenibacillus sp. 1A_MP2]|uniref:hypothetical protein n=1 Tax=Paenibacillus sp. 1A_MP2 TaxID=3457495 RepID=UPI003FCDC176
MLAYELAGTAVGDSWGRMIIIYNASKETRTTSVPSGIWNVVVEQGRVGTDVLRTVKDGQVSVPAISMMVMYSNE